LLVMYVICWYVTASLSNNVSKLLLKRFPYPLTVSLIELFVAVVLMVLTKPTSALALFRRLRHIWQWGLVLGAASLATLVLHRIAVMHLHVSYVHTIKASQPLFAVAISRLWLYEPLHNTILPPLAMIFTGVGLASAAEAQFDVLGSLAAVGSTACLATNMVLSKKGMMELELDNTMMLALVKSFSLVLLIPFWVVFDLRGAQIDLHAVDWQSAGLLVVHCIAMTVQSLASITVLSSISPVSHAVANSFKRVFVIVLAVLYFGNEVGLQNGLGVCLAIAGVHFYSKARAEINGSTKAVVFREPLLPPLSA